MTFQPLVSANRFLPILSCLLALTATASAQTGAGDANLAASATTGSGQYIVRLEAPGLLDYRGDIGNMRAVTVDSGDRPRDRVRSPAAQIYLSYLDDIQDQMLGEINNALGYPVKVIHRFKATENGFSIVLSAAEAGRIAKLAGVVSVIEEPIYQLHTDRGPTFIGADTIWDGTAVPPTGIANEGEGMVVGVIDTGINTDHPSFAEVGPVDGYVHINPFGTYLGECVGAGGAETVTCNDKLIGAYNFTGEASPEDENGHGSHTASISTGNLLNGPFIDGDTGGSFAASVISGVAPHANVIMYKACDSVGCLTAAAIDQAIQDGVDVINYSIGPTAGGRFISPWTSGDDSRFLQAVGNGIFVAASAGNTSSPTGPNPNPGGDVSHKGPWIATVANSSHDRGVFVNARVDITGPGSPPANVQDIHGLPGTGVFLVGNLIDADIFLGADIDATNNEGCNAWTGMPFAGGIALVDRGTCNFSVKIDNAEDAGAALVIVVNNQGDTPIRMGANDAMIPAIMVGQTDGQAMGSFITGAVNPTASVLDTVVNIVPRDGNVLNASSLIGPNVDFDVTKPSLTGPGTNIFAAIHSPREFGFKSGTSMSGPHVAGSGALMKAAHPDWSVMEIKSAMMLTADNTGTKADGSTPADPDDVGSGTVDLALAVQSGLVMHETHANMLAANPGAGGDPKTVNIPSMRNTGCNPECAWTRTVRSTLDGSSNWSASGTGNGFGVIVSPTSFELLGGDVLFKDSNEGTLGPRTSFQTLTISATSVSSGNVMAFGTVTLNETGAQAPDAVLTIAVSQSVPTLPPVR